MKIASVTFTLRTAEESVNASIIISFLIDENMNEQAIINKARSEATILGIHWSLINNITLSPLVDPIYST